MYLYTMVNLQLIKSQLKYEKQYRHFEHYKRLQVFLKRCSQGYIPKKSKIFEENDIARFIKDVNNDKYLVIKIPVIVNVRKTKNNLPRMFAITDKKWIKLIHKYKNLRPRDTTHSRFFLMYRNGYCINSPIGINTMGNIPKKIAAFLHLPDPHLYTGHCFRPSSATHIANSGGDILIIKRLRGWKTLQVSKGYVDSSLSKKIHVSKISSWLFHILSV
ncbi:Phage integrase domain containing protein [Asbolus verrucosus]|uniref:Phage integrase domain containing protein n=1 Tax=Asbolus verrucosus TaxID=1661398 RepID=A0A482VR92_ASBVE|nr:Phage integrase domain containing protein [Asbolus verrucosus]